MTTLGCPNNRTEADGTHWFCGGDLKLAIGPQPIKWEGSIDLVADNCPILHCPDCEYLTPSKPAIAHIQHHLSEQSKHGHQLQAPSFDEITQMKMPEIQGVSFDCDLLDNFISPFLYDKGGRFTPVYFDAEALGKYRTAGRIQMIGDTHGHIQLDGGVEFSFGINREGHVIIWYTELLPLPIKELLYLKSFNIEPDHDVASDYHEALLGRLMIPQESKETTLFRLRAEFNQKFSVILGTNFEHLTTEAHALIDSYKPPLSFDAESAGYGLVDLNNIIVETINAEPLKKSVCNLVTEKELAGKRGLKLWELYLEKILNQADARAILMPFAMLNKLRQLEPHLLSSNARKELLDEVCTNFALPLNSSLMVVYEATVIRLCQAYYRLIEIADESIAWAKSQTPHEHVSDAAYFLWRARGMGDGDDWRDWFGAQQSVLSAQVQARYIKAGIGAPKPKART